MNKQYGERHVFLIAQRLSTIYIEKKEHILTGMQLCRMFVLLVATEVMRRTVVKRHSDVVVEDVTEAKQRYQS